ncbi:MAG: multicopper oxidase domain-containing protein [Bacteroidetes bacterium]|nr:multicopper oxidase domain-containing protein [Bacteroidota bacterium]
MRNRNTLSSWAFLFGFLAWFQSGSAQQAPPQLFSGMEGYTFLPDGTPIPIWGYGWVSDGFITLPAPLLSYTEGQSVQLNFTNPSPESHTIHLHGLDVDQANDGVPGTSFLVTTGGQTTYEFTANYPGTFLYHCHVTTTLHLTMGMYGMVLVTRPDLTLFEGGPSYAQDVPLLFSDLEIETNLDPVGSYPFHDIRPDVFMVNGVSDSQLENNDQIIHFEPNQPLALRLGSMAYSRIVCQFPEQLNAICYMGDGRPLPNAVGMDSLEIYPGERFTVLINPEPGWDGHLPCEFWSMVDETLESTQFIHIRDEALDETWIQQVEAIGYPNPTRDWIQWSDAQSIEVWDAMGRKMTNAPLENGKLNVVDWPRGTYIARVDGAKPVRFTVAH